MILLLLACSAAFLAGFVDAIAGGGGLVQLPAVLLLFPQIPVVNLMATNRLVACCGTVISSIHYRKIFKFDLKIFGLMLISAFISAIFGAMLLTHIHETILRPLIVVLLVLITLYTFFNKNLGLLTERKFHGMTLQIFLLIIGLVLGFYDGFFGPGMGSLLLFCFVSLLGYSFLESSALAKITNLTANLGGVVFFVIHKLPIYKLALPMIVFNMLGNYVGAKLAIKKGSYFVRWIFLAVVTMTVLQMLWYNVPRL